MLQICYRDADGEEAFYSWRFGEDFNENLSVGKIKYISIEGDEQSFLLEIMPFLEQVIGLKKHFFYGDIARTIYMNLCEMVIEHGSLKKENRIEKQGKGNANSKNGGNFDRL